MQSRLLRPHSCCCRAGNHHSTQSPLNRRDFMVGAGAVGVALTSGGLGKAKAIQAPGAAMIPAQSLKVLPVLVYQLSERREGTSWRPWGGLHTRADVEQEARRIGLELKQLASESSLPIEVLPLAMAGSLDEARSVSRQQHDVTLIYAAGGWVDSLETLAGSAPWTLVFLRQKSGPVYLWYEIVSNRFLRKTVDEFGQPGVSTRDVVVDDLQDVAWRLRALTGLKNALNKKVVCVGGAAGWGEGGRKAPELTRRRFKMDLVEVSYDELGRRLKRARQNRDLVSRCSQAARAYLEAGGVTLETREDFVSKAFLLTEVFKDLMREAETDAITINQCMGTIMEVSGTTACLPLSLLNDDGCLAFCESDFVVIPSGILLHHISGKPVFLNDPTYPHDGLVTLAHCTAPRRMNGASLEPVRVLTHFESDWGAAPKVEMSIGQEVTVLDPDFNFERWMGFAGRIADNPFLDICRSQIDVQFGCDTDRLNQETRGFHWMVCYGNYLKETGYALEKVGIDWLELA